MLIDIDPETTSHRIGPESAAWAARRANCPILIMRGIHREHEATAHSVAAVAGNAFSLGARGAPILDVGLCLVNGRWDEQTPEMNRNAYIEKE
ncbi:hypothetical protein ACV229_27110 [Burkholderia sp. MR1-5-21]